MFSGESQVLGAEDERQEGAVEAARWAENWADNSASR